MTTTTPQFHAGFLKWLLETHPVTDGPQNIADAMSRYLREQASQGEPLESVLDSDVGHAIEYLEQFVVRHGRRVAFDEERDPLAATLVPVRDLATAYRESEPGNDETEIMLGMEGVQENLKAVAARLGRLENADARVSADLRQHGVLLAAC